MFIIESLFLTCEILVNLHLDQIQIMIVSHMYTNDITLTIL